MQFSKNSAAEYSATALRTYDYILQNTNIFLIQGGVNDLGGVFSGYATARNSRCIIDCCGNANFNVSG